LANVKKRGIDRPHQNLILEQREVEALDVAGDDLIYKVISLDVDDALRGVVAPMRISPQMNLPRAVRLR
jgi:hypothetical protein